MRKTRRLKLTALQTFTHYFIVLLSSMMPLITLWDLAKICFCANDGAQSAIELITVGLPFAVFALIAFLKQRHRLKFRIIRILNSDDEFQEAVARTCITLQWNLETNLPDFLRASDLSYGLPATGAIWSPSFATATHSKRKSGK